MIKTIIKNYRQKFARKTFDGPPVRTTIIMGLTKYVVGEVPVFPSCAEMSHFVDIEYPIFPESSSSNAEKISDYP